MTPLYVSVDRRSLTALSRVVKDSEESSRFLMGKWARLLRCFFGGDR